MATQHPLGIVAVYEQYQSETTKKLDKTLTRIIHDGRSRNRWGALRSLRRVVRIGYHSRRWERIYIACRRSKTTKVCLNHAGLFQYIDSLQQVRQLMRGAMNDRNVRLRFLLLGLPYEDLAEERLQFLVH